MGGRDGGVLSDLTTESHVEIDAGEGPPGAVGVLTLVHHPDPRWLGARCPLTERLDLGRASEIFGPEGLNARKISRVHAQVEPRQGHAWVRDLGSRNGTAVGGEAVGPAGRALRAGELLELGGVVGLLYHRGPLVYEPARHETLVGRSPALAEVLTQVAAVAPHPTPVLIRGETGTGKELVAREIHARSGRGGKLVVVNVGALGDGVFTSELFGHERGAFSGAVRAKAGLVREAQGGTLFLDEIGDASPQVQVALLRLLEQGEVRPVGASETVKVDVRIVAATHRDIEDDDRFRLDLCMRLSRWPIVLPPLRERREDIPLLFRHFAARYGAPEARPSLPLLRALLAAPWPGNVRQLEAHVERLIVERAASGAAPDTPLELRPWLARLLDAQPSAEDEGAADEDSGGTERHPDEPTARKRRFSGKRPEPAELIETLRGHGLNVKQTAQALGISRNTFYRWLNEAGIDIDALR